MKDYRKPCTSEKNLDHIILRVVTNDLISDNSSEWVGKSIVDLAKNLFHDNTKVKSPVLYRETMNEITRQN